jgi:hypothetical protein
MHYRIRNDTKQDYQTMKHSLNQAYEIAHRGHEKLVAAISEGKYVVERLGRGYFRFTKTEDGTKYETKIYVFPHDPTEYRVFCSCPFSENGTENAYCKHGVEVKALTEWEDNGPASRAIFSELMQDQREAENAHYDTLAEEWEKTQAYNKLCATAANHYPLTDSERREFIFDMLS